MGRSDHPGKIGRRFGRVEDLTTFAAPPADVSRPAAARVWTAAALIVVAVFLFAVSKAYHPGFGFTAFIHFTGVDHAREIEAARNTPHFETPNEGYDGQFYAQIALEPLLRDKTIDRPLDSPPYRARRILMPWVAYVAGLGRPAWVLEAFSLINVVVWLALAWLLARTIPPVSARGFLLWAGCLVSSGLLFSVRFALPDGPALLLVVLAVAFAEDGRLILASVLVGAAALTRETSILAGVLFIRDLRAKPRTWMFVALCVLISVLPLALWLDYLRSIYRSFTLAGGDQVMAPFEGFRWKVASIANDLRRTGLQRTTVSSIASAVAFVAQAVWATIELVRRDGRSRWALVAGAFVLMAMTTTRPVWEDAPGAFTRVFLPLSVGVNILLARRPNAPWPMLVLTNLGVVSGAILLVYSWP